MIEAFKAIQQHQDQQQPSVAMTLEQVEATRERFEREMETALGAPTNSMAKSRTAEGYSILELQCLWNGWRAGYMASAERQAQSKPAGFYTEVSGKKGVVWHHGAPADDTAVFTAPPAVPSDYFASLVERARISADKAMIKHPQPNYVLLKVAEEAGEVVQAAVHYAENRMSWEQVEGEIVQLIAMLIRLVTEGDQVNGVIPPESCRSMLNSERDHG